jgi:hypothetical protein
VPCIGVAVVGEPGGKIVLESCVTLRQGRIVSKGITEGEFVQVAG